jgi:N-methylhydantoinase A/oxoprolinase/acetone carboxylase beta subunit
MMLPEGAQFEIGVDIGGTFTDVVVAADDGTLSISKIPSSRADPSSPMRTVVSNLSSQLDIAPKAVRRLVHGTTVATNAVLERRGAKVGLLTTSGFEGVLEIGRQNRTQLYDLFVKPETPSFIAPGAYRCGVVESIDAFGAVQVPLDRRSLEESLKRLVDLGVDAIAICFLFSYANSVHEREAKAYVEASYPDLPVSISSELDPAFREYERTSVTAFDAYVKPILNRYLEDMERLLVDAGVSAPLQIMQSRGGINSAKLARSRPIRLFLSGPAAGVIGASELGLSIGQNSLITLDVGGTSSDIALISGGRPMIRSEGFVDGYRVRVPMVDVNAIGAGGGSIAWIDSGGGLRVGPRSAGAEPGPACYGRGGKDATVTDASLVLGYLTPEYFAGGTLAIDRKLAHEAIFETIARPLGMSVEEAALGIHRVVTAQMAEGIRAVSVARGVDPRAYALVPFGGGGGLHATALADQLSMTSIVVPRYPGVLSAMGLLSAPIEHESNTSFFRRFDETEPAKVVQVLEQLRADCSERMAAETLPGAQIETSYSADVCYVGQSHYLEVPVAVDDLSTMIEGCSAAFRSLHEQIYGHATDAPMRFVNLRAVLRCPFPSLRQNAATAAQSKRAAETRAIRVAGAAERITVRVYQRDSLAVGEQIPGPAIVEQADTTTLIEPGWAGSVHPSGVLLLTREP